jgi:hypothetical protein
MVHARAHDAVKKICATIKKNFAVDKVIDVTYDISIVTRKGTKYAC